jgi:hypothetical protein
MVKERLAEIQEEGEEEERKEEDNFFCELQTVLENEEDSEQMGDIKQNGLK